ncbi:MAG: PilZ domain-containing protein [Candidatus Angelobacter sp.]
MQLPETQEPLKIKAEVRYRQGFQYGFKFVHITEQQKEMIRRTTRDLHLAL